MCGKMYECVFHSPHGCRLIEQCDFTSDELDKYSMAYVYELLYVPEYN